mmetsp:Transcript_64463/g.139993  ORF Transcript_64463/g.139993 Transcript_64463/m.139993 type:complete len:547 (+) Transcript_64463:3-1643(+)
MEANGALPGEADVPLGLGSKPIIRRQGSALRSMTGRDSEPIAPQRMGTHRYIKGTTVEKPATYDGNALWAILVHPMNVLLVFCPLGTAAYFLHWDAVYCFWFNFFAMIPLAKILGDATEELAASLKNDMVAGLLNATFGNAVEMVITVKTLKAGLYDVVKSTLLGSVLSNTLLVLGMSFLCGGLVTLSDKDDKSGGPAAQYSSGGEYKSVPIDAQSPEGRVASNEGSSSARLERMGSKQSQENQSNMAAPLVSIDETTVVKTSVDVVVKGPEGEVEEIQRGISMYEQFDGAEKIQNFSVLGALVNTSMLLISCMSFSLITVFRQVSHNETEGYVEDVLLPVSRIASIIIILAYVAYTLFQLVTHKGAMAVDQEEDEGDDPDEHLSAVKACVLLFFTTVIVSCCTEMLVHAIGGVTEHAHLSKHFIGIILLPIVGNACEHAAAVRFAMQDKLGLSVSIAVGSSTQIALFVVPFSVLAGWCFGKPMDLNFGTLSTSMITLSVIVVLSMVVDGQSNWLQGYLLCSVYCIIAVMYWYLPDELHDSLNPSD